MRMILGILTPDGGTISWNGTPLDARIRDRFGYLPEERGLYGRMRVRDHITYFGRLRGIGKSDSSRWTAEWIEHLELQQYADRPCAELSKGNQQKVQVACAAVHRPEILVLDEPFSGLDPVNAELILSVLRELQTNGTTLVLSSHEMWQLERLCTDFCIIARGRNLAAGTLADLRRGWPGRRVRVAPGSAQALQILETIEGARQIERNDVLVPSTYRPRRTLPRCCARWLRSNRSSRSSRSSRRCAISICTSSRTRTNEHFRYRALGRSDEAFALARLRRWIDLWKPQHRAHHTLARADGVDGLRPRTLRGCRRASLTGGTGESIAREGW